MDAIEDAKFPSLTNSPNFGPVFNSLHEQIDLSSRALNATIDSNHATLIWCLNIHKRLRALERNQPPECRAETASPAPPNIRNRIPLVSRE